MALRRGPVQRGPGGSVLITLPVGERNILAHLAHGLVEVVSEVDPTQPPDALRARLFPRAYEDPLDQNEYAEMNTEPLAATKRKALDTFAATLRAGTEKGGMWRAQLDDEQVHAWLGVLNDARLVLGTVAGIETETDWEDLRDDADESAILLDYLSMLQESLLELV